MFTTTIAAVGGEVLIILDGELDTWTRERLPSVPGEARRVVVDAGAVTFVDSSGLDALIGLVTEARGRGVEVQWARTSERLERVARLLAVAEPLGLTATVLP